MSSGHRYVIAGAGAVGATIGGLLAESGQPVVLVARGAHLAALRRDGLRLTTPDRELRLALPAVSLEDLELTVGDVIVLGVKSQHTADALVQLAGVPVGRSTAGQAVPIFCAQNGISNEATALRYFAQVHGLSVHLPATHIEPGQVDSEGSPFSGVLEIGRYPGGVDEADRQFAHDLTAANFVATERADVMAWKRTKLLRNLRNALQVLVGLDDDPVLTEVIARAIAEGRACFAAAGLTVTPEEDYTANLGRRSWPTPLAGRERTGGSTWQSVERGQGSVETDFLNGEIVRLGRVHGVATPVNEAIQAQMWTFLRAGPDYRIRPSDLLA